MRSIFYILSILGVFALGYLLMRHALDSVSYVVALSVFAGAIVSTWLIVAMHDRLERERLTLHHHQLLRDQDNDAASRSPQQQERVSQDREQRNTEEED